MLAMDQMDAMAAPDTAIIAPAEGQGQQQQIPQQPAAVADPTKEEEDELEAMMAI